MSDAVSNLEQAEHHHEEAANLTEAAAAEVEEVVSQAEEAVTEVAQDSQEEVQDAHETIVDAEREVEEAVSEEAHEAAEELGEPALAEQIAEGLFRRLDERGILPHTQHHETHPVSEGETIVSDVEALPGETVAEVEQVEETAQQVADHPPEPTHWWYRNRPVFRRR